MVLVVIAVLAIYSYMDHGPAVVAEGSIAGSPLVVVANLGQPALLTCDIRSTSGASNSTSYRYWLTPDNRTLLLDADDSNTSLYISAAQETDAGLYTCVDNSTDAEQLNYTMFLSVVSEPTILHEVSTIRAPSVVVVNSSALNVSWEDVAPAMSEDNLLYILNIREEDIEIQSIDLPSDRRWMVVGDLKPFTVYTVSLLSSNSSIDLAGNESLHVQARTASAAPSGKPNISRYVTYRNAVYIEWEPPIASTWNGDITGFNLIYENNETLTRYEISIPRHISYPPTNQSAFLFTNITQNVRPDSAYRIQVNAFNEAGSGPHASIDVRTKKAISVRQHLRARLKYRSGRTLHLDWSEPEFSKRLQYNISWSDSETEKFSLTPATEYAITGLVPHREYKIVLTAYDPEYPHQRALINGNSVVRVVDDDDDYEYDDIPYSSTTSLMTDVEGPSRPILVNVSSNQSNVVIVTWLRPQNYTFRIDEYRIRYYNRMSGTTKLQTINEFDWSKDLYEAVLTNAQPSTVYEVEVAGATRSLFSQQIYVGPFSAVVEVITVEEVVESNSVLWVALAIVSALLLIVIIIAVSLFVRYCMRERYQFVPDQDSSRNGPECFQLTQIYDPKTCSTESIPVEKFEDHVIRLHSDGDYLLSQEYEEINRNVPINASTRQSCDEDNKHKNRYLNILAYDHSRVLLKILSGRPRHTDYINANYIDGYKKQRAFIATQGPLPSTFGDFWRMVWEQNSSVIVMITNLTEKGRRKCDQYWPNEGEQHYEGFIVRFLSSAVTAHYTVRTFSLRPHKQKKKLDGERVVVQYHYTDWPDHGVPAFAIPTLSFVSRSAECNSENSGPIVVHCSAGVGRTGTYIVIDSMMRQINDLKTVNVFGFLSHIRAQRNFLVQTEDQYSFIHEVLLEYVLSGDTEVHDVNYVRDCVQATGSTDTISFLHRQYTLVTRFQPKDFHLTSARLPVNESKNRSHQYLPVEIARVYLPMKAGVEGSDYINASYFQGCTRNEEFIITQHPLSATVNDFWHMIWDQNSKVIILLSSPSQLETGESEEDRQGKINNERFWPSISDDPLDCGQFKVKYKQEYTLSDGSLVTELMLESSEDDFELVQIIQNGNWLQPQVEQTSRVCAINFVHVVRQRLTESDNNDVCSRSPAVVIDWYGGSDGAMFCALMTLHDELNQAGCLNVYTVSKLYHMKRPNVFPSLESYRFLYDCVEVLFERYQSNSFLRKKHADSDLVNCNNHVDPSACESPSAVSVKQNLLSIDSRSIAATAVVHSPESNGGATKSDEIL